MARLNSQFSLCNRHFSTLYGVIMHKQSLIIIACFILTACQSAPEGPRTEPPAIPVLAVNPSVQDVPIYIETIGTLQPSIFMEIKPQVNGTLTDVLVKEG